MRCGNNAAQSGSVFLGMCSENEMYGKIGAELSCFALLTLVAWLLMDFINTMRCIAVTFFR